ncbi:UNVERIFIED_CONTAM: hypothetical protein FKN15_049823 [Acipenser sinensis]
MDQLKVKDRILENISLSVKKLQSYFAACEDETPAIRNHDRVLQRLCEHLDHALLYGLQDISSGYWVLVLHFTRREAIKQIEELQHIATNIGRSRAWLYLALSESSLESYLRLFQENRNLLHKYYFKNALVCSDDHLTLFLTLVSGLEFIRFNLDLDVPYLDLAPYMPDYYKPQNLLDFEERLPSSDSLSLNSIRYTAVLTTFNQRLIVQVKERHCLCFRDALVCSDDHLTLFLTLVSGLEFIRFNLDLDVPYLDLAPYMPDYYKPQNLLDFEERLPSSDSLSLNSFNSITSTNLEWDDSAIAPSSEDYDFGDMFPALQSVPSVNWEEGDLTDSVSCPRSAACEPPLLEVAVRSPTLRYNPFNEESDTATSTEVTPVHHNSRDRSDTAEDDTESTGTELEVIRLARRRKPCKKKQGKVEPVSNHMSSSGLESRGQEELSERESGDTQEPLVERGGPEDSLALPEEDVGDEGLRLPEMTDISMDSVGQPLREVMDQLNGALDTDRWRTEESNVQQPFWESSGGEPPDPPLLPLDQGLLQTPPPNNFYRFTPESPGPASPGGGHYDPAGDGQPPNVLGGHEGEGAGEVQTEEAGEAARPLEERRVDEGEEEVHNGAHLDTDNSIPDSPKPIPGQGPPKHCVIEEDESSSPSEVMHPAEFRVDNNHLLLLMIHVFRENEEQLFKMIRMSTGHMEGNMQLLYLLFTDCYIYLLRKGAAEKPYTVEEAVSYNELDYISVGMDQQTVTLVCTNRRRQFLLDTADESLTEWFLATLKSAVIKGYREPPYPSILTDATMEKLALTKFVAQESQCEVTEVSVQLYALVHWEDPMDVTVGHQGGPYMPGENTHTKEGVLHYKAGTSYLGKENWKSCYLVLSNGILYQYPERTDVTPLLSVSMGGEQCGGCRRSNTTDRPHSFQVILSERPALELSADNEEDMADWMQYLCQAVSKGVRRSHITTRTVWE